MMFGVQMRPLFLAVAAALVAAAHGDSRSSAWFRSRSLSEELIAGFEPKTDVTDHVSDRSSYCRVAFPGDLA